MRILFPLLFITNVYSQSVLNFDTYENDDVQIKQVFDTVDLAISKPYTIEVVGTYSAWNPWYWSSSCGDITSAPMFPSSSGPMTGNVSHDFEYGFSYPTSSLCNGTTFPFSSVRFEISLDNGVTWFHPITTDVYNSLHTYTYQLEGQGFPLGVRHISPYNSDDYGILKFTIQSNSVAVVENTDKPERIRLYPNPASDEISVDYHFEEKTDYNIYNSLGELVLSGAYERVISIEQLQPGSYFIELKNEFGIHRSSFVKK